MLVLNGIFWGSFKNSLRKIKVCRANFSQNIFWATKNAPKFSLNFLSLYCCRSAKIPQNSLRISRQISLRKSRKIHRFAGAHAIGGTNRPEGKGEADLRVRPGGPVPNEPLSNLKYVDGVFQSGFLWFGFGGGGGVGKRGWKGGLERGVGEGLARGWGRVGEGSAFMIQKPRLKNPINVP